MGAGVGAGLRARGKLVCSMGSPATYIKEAVRNLLGVSPNPTRSLRGLPKGKPFILAFYFPHEKETGVPQGLGVPALLSFLLSLHRARHLGGGGAPLLVRRPMWAALAHVPKLPTQN